MMKILDMRPISSKKHEWNFANVAPISISKHKMSCSEFCFLQLWDQYVVTPAGESIKNNMIIFPGPKHMASPNVFKQTTHFHGGGILINFGNMEIIEILKT